MRILVRILILTTFILCPIVKASPSTSTRSYLFKNSVISSLQSQHSLFLLAQQTQDPIRLESKDYTKLKDPNTALLYAAVPGFIVHGAGHFYAGRTGTGFILLGTELVGATLFIGGGMTGWGSPSPTPGGFAVALTGGLMFFGSWIYDMVKSPLIVKEQNEEILKRTNTDLKFQLKDGGLRLALVYHF